MNDRTLRKPMEPHKPKEPNQPRKPILLIVALLLAGLCTRPAPAEVIEEIIAQVNDKIIVLSEYKRSLETLRQELGQDLRGLELEARFRERSKDTLRELIDQQLLAQKGAELGVNVESEVVKRLDEIRTQMKLDSMEALEQAVEKQGMNYEDFKQNMRDGILTQRVIGREVGSRVQVPPAEISAYYEQHKKELERPEGVRIQEILISTEGKPEEELPSLQAKADEVLAKARQNQDFAELARQYSDDPTASNGGDAGFFERGLMAPEIEGVAYSLKKNQVGDIIRTKFGLLIIKLLDHTTAGIPPLAEVESQIHERLYLQKIQPALREYLTKLRQESYISIKTGYVDTGEPPKQASVQNP